MNKTEKTEGRKTQVKALESIFRAKFNVRFPLSYREFLLKHGNMEVAGFSILGIPKREEAEEAETKEEEETVLFFRPGDLRKGRFAWVSNYEGKIVGLCSLPNCRYCNLAGREQLKDFQGGNLKVSLYLVQRPAGEFYVAHFVSIPKPEAEAKKPARETSIVEATQFLIQRRPDLKDRKLVPIYFKTDLHTDKRMVLCMDLSESPEDDAPLVVVTDLDQQGTAPFPSAQKTFSEWLDYIQKMEIRHKHFRKALRRVRNRNNEVLKKELEKEFSRGEFKDRFGSNCPICELRARKTIVDYHTQQPKTLLTCQECQDEWEQLGLDGKKSDFIEWVHKKVEEKGYNLPCFTHKGTKIINDKEVEPKYIKVKPHYWHSRIYRAVDYVVGLTAFRYNYQLGCLEVDAFWSGDLAGYVKGQAIRNLAIAVLSEANSLTGSLALTFTRDLRENSRTGKLAVRNWRRRTEKLTDIQKREADKNNGRICRPVPRQLVRFAKKCSVELSQAEQGVISHQDGLNIFWAALGWPAHLEVKVGELEKKGYLTRQALAGVIYSGIWSLEEAIWIFENAPRPEAILLGSDLPEDRLYYTDSLAWARSAYTASLLKTKVSSDLAGGLSVEEREESDCELEPYGGFWLLKSAKDFILPWVAKGSDLVPIKAGEPVLILSVPCQTTQEANDLALIKEGFKALKQTESPAKIRCLIVSFEFSDLKYGMKVAEFMKNNSKLMAEKGVYLLFSPYRLDLLNDEVESRMFNARRRRQFPPRKTTLRLQLIEIPEARWQKPDLLYSVQDAKSAAYWIEKKVDLRLGRIRFRVNCSCIERIAVQDANAKFIAVADGQDSKDILAAMASESGITAPFVPPDEMPEFAKEVGGKLRNALKAVKGGLVVLASFEKSESPEETETTAMVAEVHAVASEFRFSVNLDSIDVSNCAIKRPDEIARTHRQIQQALRTGEPLAVSYLRHEVFVEAIREYLFKKGRIDQVNLRIVYNDGGESRPFPLFCLTERKKPEGMYQMKVGSISIRHAALDLVTDGYLIQNVMISKRKLSSVEQEDYAFRQTRHFLAEFVDLLQHKRVKEVTGDIRFRYLWSLLGLEGKKSKGCELHIFQTGLTPATVGIYRAVVEFLQERRGELVVVPRLIGKKADAEKAIDAEYLKAAEWF